MAILARSLRRTLILFYVSGGGSMKNFSIELRAISPLAIRADHAPEEAETARFITGITLAGSLAAVHRLLRSEAKEEFERVFVSGQVHYPNLYPASFKD